MAYQIVTSSQNTCPGWGSQWVRQPVSGGTVISVGWQNDGNATHLFPTQMFVHWTGGVYGEVTNQSPLATNWWFVAVVDADDDAEVSFGDAEVHEAPIERPSES